MNAMIKQCLSNGKTLTGSAVLVAVYVLGQLGIATDEQQILSIVGVAVTLAGWAHKIYKNKKRM